jgi:hypothetical protein
MKKTTDWNIWQTVFLVPMVVVNIPRGEAIDAAHARAGLIFRVFVTLVCAVGLIVVSIRRRSAEPVRLPDGSLRPLQPTPLSATMPATEIIPWSYSSSMESLWRCNKYALLHQPANVATLFVFGTVIALLASTRFKEMSTVLALALFPVFLVIGTVLWGLFILGVTRMALQGQFAASKIRTCRTSLTPEGAVDETPEAVRTIPWRRMRRVVDHEGDIFFFSKGLAGMIIPRDAFSNDEDRRAFFNAAEALCRSQGAEWVSVISDPAVQRLLQAQAAASSASADGLGFDI